MKHLKLILIAIVLFLSGNAKAQVVVNIGTPPLWGPAGYSEVRYYYLPDVEAYYDVNSSMFIYYGNGVWLRRTHLPNQYRNYDLYGGYKVVMTDYRGNDPYIYFKDYKRKYAKGYHGGAQKTIGEKPGKGNSNNKNGSNANATKKSNHSNGNVQQGNNKNGGQGNNSNGGHGNKGNGGGGGKGKKK